MSDTIGGAPAPGPQAPDVASLDLSKFFGPAPTERVPMPTPLAETPAEATPVEKPLDEAAATDKPAAAGTDSEPAVKSELAEALNEWRAERKVADSAKQEATTWKGKYEAVTEELEQLRSAPAFEDDPIAYVKARKWTPEQQTQIVQLLAYDLAPDKAPEGFRFKIFEARQAAEKARERAEREAQMAQAQQAEVVQQLQAFIGGLEAAAATFSPGAFPANEDWYGENRKAYVTDLYKVANELANEATAKGEKADLTAAILAAKLEQTNAGRLTALESRRGKRKPTAAPAQSPAEVAMQSDRGPASTQGLNTGGPRPPAQTEEERIRRATLAAFGGR